MGEQCEFCWSNFKTIKYLEHHQKTTKYCEKYKNVVFTCCKCNYTTRGIKNIDKHINTCKATGSCDNPFTDLKQKIADLEAEISSYKNLDFNGKTSSKKEEELEILLRLERFKNQLYLNIIEKNTRIRIDDIMVEKENGIHIYDFQGGNIPIFVHEISKNIEGVTVNSVPKETTSLSHDIESVDNDFQESAESINDDIKEKDSESKEKDNDTREKDSDTREKDSDTREKDSNNLIEKIIEHIDEKVTQHVSENLTEHLDDQKNKAKKQNYRSVKSCIELVPERNIEEKEFTIQLIDIDIRQQIDNFSSLEESQKIFNNCFNTLKQSRIYTKILGDLREQRWKVFGGISAKEYEKLILDHIKIIEGIFHDKNYSEKKSSSIILKGLSPLESRLTGYGNYTTSHLEVDEIQRLDLALDLHIDKTKDYTPFDGVKVCEYLHNYGSVLFPIRKSIYRYFFNLYGFNNVVYIALPKNTDEDPYSFYILDRVNKDKRYWKMDCRLENIVSSVITNVLPYMISMFRKLYRAVYDDNDYRMHYNNKCQITECDCEQLLQNILLLGQPKEFRNLIRKIVKEKSTYKPTEKDKFNLYGDDALQRKRFQEKEDTDLVEIIKQLFDGITSEEAVDFYRSRIA
jgi:hypothetical protein